MSRSTSSSVIPENSEGPDNTPLHNAIITNDKERAFRWLEADIKEFNKEKKTTLINEKSLGNTPLLLALKTGNIEIAEAILAHPGLQLAFSEDSRGLSALHWACMLRQNKIISLILNTGGIDSMPVAKWWKHSAVSEQKKTSPFYLYYNPVIPFHMLQYARSGIFCDSAELIIRGAETYTDCMFHMRSLCTNLHWYDEAKKLNFVSTENKENDPRFLRTADIFKHNYQEGIASFCKYRNAIPVDRELAIRLADSRTDKDENFEMDFRVRDEEIALARAIPRPSSSVSSSTSIATTLKIPTIITTEVKTSPPSSPSTSPSTSPSPSSSPSPHGSVADSPIDPAAPHPTTPPGTSSKR